MEGMGGGSYPTRHIQPSCRPEKHPQRSLEGVRYTFTKLQDTRDLLVLPTGPKAHVMDTCGLTRLRTSCVKKADLVTYNCFISVPGKCMDIALLSSQGWAIYQIDYKIFYAIALSTRYYILLHVFITQKKNLYIVPFEGGLQIELLRLFVNALQCYSNV